MKHKIKVGIIISLLTLTPFHSALPANQIYASVPFGSDIVLQPNQVIWVSYNFGNHPVIYCYEDTFQFLGSMQWSYNNQINNNSSSECPFVNNTTPLSQCSLTTNTSIYGGLPADPSGAIKITNNSNTTLNVNCQYGF